jgi:hypothetical protein
MAPLHFGNFAGMLSKAIWFGLGFAMCYVTFTGLPLWLARRDTDGRSLGWLDRIVGVVGWGLPFALVVTAAAFLVTMPLGSAVYWTPASFLIASGAAILCGLVMRSGAAIGHILQMGTALVMVTLPALRLVTGGPGWSAAIAVGQPIIVALDLAFLLAGGWMIWLGADLQFRRAERGQPSLQPAE